MSKYNRRDILKAGLGAAMVVPAVALSDSPAARAATGVPGLRADGLRCENVVDPLGVDVVRPRVSWRLAAGDGARGKRQTAYHILAASSSARLAQGHGDLWDSGQVMSDVTLHVPYGGRTLTSAQQVFWKVRVRDESGTVSAWSAQATWTMGLLDPSDWPPARWIGVPAMSGLIGYHAAETGAEDDVKWVQVDLRASLPISEVRLIPMDHVGVKGFGFPLRYMVQVSDDAEFKSAPVLLDRTGADIPSPGDAPMIIPARDLRARYVRVTATKLWKRDATVYAFALSQMQVFSGGRNVAVGADVTAKDGVEAFGWGRAGLTDGRGAETIARQQSVLLRREFRVEPKLHRALAFVCGLGQYEVSINGRRVGDALLTPGWSLYSKTCLYDTYDVTALLTPGANAAGLILGSGMYDIGPDPVRYVKFERSDGPPKAIVLLRLEYADGTTKTVGSDKNWQIAPGPITFSNVYAGEDHDARRVASGWDQPGFRTTWPAALETTGPGGTLRGLTHAAPPIRMIETLAPVKVTPLRPGVIVYDFGQNASVMPRLKVHGPVGSSVRIIPSELVGMDGAVDRSSCTQDGVRPAWWQYTLAGGDTEHWFPKFFTHGSRYFQVELRPPDGRQDLPTLDRLEAVVVHSSSRPVGEFETSNDLFNRIFRLIRWAERNNMMSLMTDCPHRERLGWLEETQLNGPSLRYNFDMAPLMAKVVSDMADSQFPNGFVPNIAPEYFIAGEPELTNGFRNSPEWGGAFVLVPWQQYLFSGDSSLLDRHYEDMKRYVAFLASTAQGDIIPTGLGDWYDVGPNPPWGSQLTPPPFTATAFYYYDNLTMAQAATVLGHGDDAQKFNADAQRIRASFNQHFFNPQTGTYATGSQTCCAFPLAMGLAEPDTRPRLLQMLISDIQAHGTALTTGEIGYRFLLRALADSGRSDIVFALNNQSDKPGYGYQLKKGATSLTEKWDASVGSFGSQDHFMSGEVIEWFYHDLVGIGQDPDSAGFGKIVIRPAFVGDLTFVHGRYDSVRGLIDVGWRRQGSDITLNVTVPPNATATIYVPAASGDVVQESGVPAAHAPGIEFLRAEAGAAIYHVGSGVYRFTSTLIS